MATMQTKKELAEALNKGMSYLTDIEKYALMLTYYEDLNIYEILAILEIDAVEYKKQITNAKTKMRHFTNMFDELDKKFGIDKMADVLIFG